MKWLRRGLCVLVVLAASNLVAVFCTWPLYGESGGAWRLPLALLAWILLALFLVRPMGKSTFPTRRIRTLAEGGELLGLFLVTATVNLGATLWFLQLLSPWAGTDGYEKGVGWLVFGPTYC